MTDPISEPLSSDTRLARLRTLVVGAKEAGIQIRSEWLGGETGGACELGEQRWIFIDLSLSIAEQVNQVEDAIRYHAKRMLESE